MIETPRIVVTEPLHYAGLHQVVPSSEMAKIMWPGIGEVLGVLAEQHVKPVGPWFTHHLKLPTDTFDFEICMHVAEPVQAAGRVVPGTWPAMTVARTVYHGSYAQLPHAWGEFREWMIANHHAQGTEFWERYLVNPNDTPDQAAWRTELNWPIAG
jgi:effector-binding domain-containing protein